MTNEELLEKLEETVCDLCHWPFAYRDGDVMQAERCDYCQAIKIVTKLRQRILPPDPVQQDRDISNAITRATEEAMKRLRQIS